MKKIQNSNNLLIKNTQKSSNYLNMEPIIKYDKRNGLSEFYKKHYENANTITNARNNTYEYNIKYHSVKKDSK